MAIDDHGQVAAGTVAPSQPAQCCTARGVHASRNAGDEQQEANDAEKQEAASQQYRSVARARMLAE